MVPADPYTQSISVGDDGRYDNQLEPILADVLWFALIIGIWSNAEWSFSDEGHLPCAGRARAGTPRKLRSVASQRGERPRGTATDGAQEKTGQTKDPVDDGSRSTRS